MRSRRSIIGLLILSTLLLIALAAPVWAQSPPIIDRELFFGDPEIAGAQISPDGAFIAFIKPFKGTRNVWVKKTGEPFASLLHPNVPRAFERLDKGDKRPIRRDLRARNLRITEEKLAVNYGRALRPNGGGKRD